MRGLDETDREILRLLLADGRRPYSEIAETVDLSPPAVSDRIDRLSELGVIRRFTVDIDRAKLREGALVLVTIHGTPGTGTDIQDGLTETDRVEHLFRTADDTVVCTVVAPPDIGGFLAEHLPLDAVRDYTVRVLQDSSWLPQLDQAELAPECAECGNSVTSEGERERIDGEVYHFCCSSCRQQFVDHYEQLSERA